MISMVIAGWQYCFKWKGAVDEELGENERDMVCRQRVVHRLAEPYCL